MFRQVEVTGTNLRLSMDGQLRNFYNFAGVLIQIPMRVRHNSKVN